jgi:hypothetical protein
MAIPLSVLLFTVESSQAPLRIDFFRYRAPAGRALDLIRSSALPAPKKTATGTILPKQANLAGNHR